MDNAAKQQAADAERLKLAEKLDRELEEFISGLERRPYTEGWPEDRWEEEMEKHPFFMKKAPEPGDSLHPLMEGLQQLKYDPDENSPEELANAYKEDGNFNFKHKKYRLAIIAYTEAIKVKCGNPDVQATLHNNRSAANYFLQNYFSALRDAEIALRLKPTYEKALVRAAHCAYMINQLEKAVDYCDSLLAKHSEDKDILELRQKCINAIKMRDRDMRRKARIEKERSEGVNALLQRILENGVNVEGGNTQLKLESLQPQFQELADHRVHFNEDGMLVWPVVFVYPEYKTMDFIQNFAENQRFSDHLQAIFEDPPEWDVKKKYTPESITMYFENRLQARLYCVNTNDTLADTLRRKEFIVISGTPSFMLFVRGSLAEADFINQQCVG